MKLGKLIRLTDLHWKWLGFLLLFAALAVVACAQARPTATPTAPPLPQAVTLDGVTYRAETRIEKSSPTAEIAPVMLRPWVTMTNTTDLPAMVALEGCAVRLRVYQDSSRLGPRVWDARQNRERQGGRCMQEPYTVALGPGESYEVADAISAAGVLNDSVSPGRYYFTILLALESQPLELAAGDVELSYGIEDLTFMAQTSVGDIAPRKLSVAVLVTNTSNKRVHIEYGDCAVWLRAYRTPDRSGTPAWDERKGPWGCDDYLASTELAPGESASPPEFQKVLPEPDIMGDSLPDGRYYFMATVEVNDTSVEVRAGEVDLTRVQAPLPSARTVGSLRYEARTELLANPPGLLRTIVMVTNASQSPVKATIARDCPVLIYAYKDKGRRDAAFRSGEPDWRPPDICYLEMDKVTLAPGESREFEARVSVSEVLKLPPGRYYFVANVVTRTNNIVLSAGQADLSY